MIAFNQIAHKKIDPKSHVNELDPLLGLLRKRTGVIFLKRLTIVLDEDSEKGFGLVSLFSSHVARRTLNILLDKWKYIPCPTLRYSSFDTNHIGDLLPCVPNALSSIATDCAYNFSAAHTPTSPVPPKTHSCQNGNKKWCSI